MNSIPLSPTTWVLAACTTLATGQDAPTSVATATTAAPDLSLSHGVNRAGHRVFAHGSQYSAEFFRNGWAFTPHMPRSDRPETLRFALTSVARSNAEAGFSTAPVEPVVDPSAAEVRYPRRHYTEVYEARVEGLKQSFIFEALPEGTGDLVVRLSVDTALPLDLDTPGRISFERSGFGGTIIESVVGIDARGKRRLGSMQLDGQHLELRLPADFVASAALPLVLDPLVTPIWTVTSSGSPRSVAVAHGITVWERVSAISTRELYARVGNATVLVSTFIDAAPNLRVATRGSINGHVLVWDDSDSIWACAIDVGFGGPHVGVPAVLAAPQSGDTVLSSPVISSSSLGLGGKFVVAWKLQDFLGNAHTKIQARALEVSGGANLTFLNPIRNLTDGTDDVGFPQIAKSGGLPGRHLVTWRRETSNGDRIRGAVIDNSMQVLVSQFGIANDPNISHFGGQCDGDGKLWVVAYTIDAAQPQGGSSNLAARTLHFDEDSSTVEIGTQRVISDTSERESPTDVAWLGQSALVTYVSGSNPNMELRVASIDPFRCTTCEGDFQIASTTTGGFSCKIGTEAFDGLGSDHPRIGFAKLDNNGSSIVRSVDFNQRPRRPTDLGGGCADGGQNFATCALTGNDDFRLRLRNAAPNRPVLLILSGARIDASLQNSTLVPDPFLGFLQPGLTQNEGHTNTTLALPDDSALINLEFYTQWLVDLGSPGCTGFDYALSNALRVRIQ